MKPSILISGTIAAPTAGKFSLEDGGRPAMIYAEGLAGAETAVLQVMTSDGTYLSLVDGSGALQLSATVTVLKVDMPGEYQVLVASSVGAIEVGCYGPLR